MSLNEKPTRIREGATKRIPAEKLAAMLRATEDLRGSGILGGMLKTGDRLPPFELPNARGATVASQVMLGMGAGTHGVPGSSVTLLCRRAVCSTENRGAAA